MSDSLIPMAPPAYVRLDADGLQDWRRYMPDAQPEDLYRVVEWDHLDYPQHARIISGRSGLALYMRKCDTVHVEQDHKTGLWEEVV